MKAYQLDMLYFNCGHSSVNPGQLGSNNNNNNDNNLDVVCHTKKKNKFVKATMEQTRLWKTLY